MVSSNCTPLPLRYTTKYLHFSLIFIRLVNRFQNDESENIFLQLWIKGTIVKNTSPEAKEERVGRILFSLSFSRNFPVHWSAFCSHSFPYRGMQLRCVGVRILSGEMKNALKWTDILLCAYNIIIPFNSSLPVAQEEVNLHWILNKPLLFLAVNRCNTT